MTDKQIHELGNRIQDRVRAINPDARANVSWDRMEAIGVAVAVTLGVRGSPLEDIAQMHLAAHVELKRLAPGGMTWTICVAQV